MDTKTKEQIEKDMEILNEEVSKKGMDQNSYLEEKELLKNYEDMPPKEETYWRKKSRETWLGEGKKTPNYSIIENKYQ